MWNPRDVTVLLTVLLKKKNAYILVCHNKWEEGATGIQCTEVRRQLNTTKKGSVSCTICILLKNVILIP